MSHGLVLLSALLAQGPAPALAGRWDLTVEGGGQKFPGWLEVTRSEGGLTGRLQWGWGHATPIVDVATTGRDFRFTWPDEDDPKAAPSRAEGTVDRSPKPRLSARLTGADGTVDVIAGTPAPALPASARDTAAWGAPVDLLAGGLSAWRVRAAQDGWTLTEGVLSNRTPSSDLISRQQFQNFKLHLEVEVPAGGNSGIYLRGRHEVQVLDSWGKPTGSREMGGVYGQVTPSSNAARRAGEWQSYDITFVGRRVKVVLNGVTVIDFAEIPGITGGALDSEEAAPGPLMLQGDHTGVRYRNVLVTPAVREGVEEATVRRFERERFAAMVRADTAFLRPALAEELSYTHSNGLVETKAEHLAGLAGRRTVYESIAPVGFTYRRMGEAMVGHGMVKAKGTLGGTPFDVTLRVTTVHVLRQGRWQLAAWQSTRLP